MKPIAFVPKNWPWYKLYPRWVTELKEGKPIAWCKSDMEPCDANEDQLPDVSLCLLCSCYTSHGPKEG